MTRTGRPGGGRDGDGEPSGGRRFRCSIPHPAAPRTGAGYSVAVGVCDNMRSMGPDLFRFVTTDLALYERARAAGETTGPVGFVVLCTLPPPAYVSAAVGRPGGRRRAPRRAGRGRMELNRDRARGPARSRHKNSHRSTRYRAYMRAHGATSNTGGAAPAKLRGWRYSVMARPHGERCAAGTGHSHVQPQ